MILYYLIKFGVLSSVDREKILFFLGFAPSPLYLSRRWPLVRSIHWTRAIFSPSYARHVAMWLAYRTELYDGRQG